MRYEKNGSFEINFKTVKIIKCTFVVKFGKHSKKIDSSEYSNNFMTTIRARGYHIHGKARIDQKWYWLGNDGQDLTTTQQLSWVKVKDHGVTKYMYRQLAGSFATNESFSINCKNYHFEDGRCAN